MHPPRSPASRWRPSTSTTTSRWTTPSRSGPPTRRSTRPRSRRRWRPWSPRWSRSSARPRCSAPTATCGSPRTRRPTRRTRARSCRPGPSTGWYVQVGAPGVRVGVGFYEAELPAAGRDPRRDRGRPARPASCEEIVAGLTAAGWELGGETLKTSPRGYDADHPRIDLLRHKSMTLGRSYGFEPVIHTAGAARPGPGRTGAPARPFVEWVTARTACTEWLRRPRSAGRGARERRRQPVQVRAARRRQPGAGRRREASSRRATSRTLTLTCWE